MCCSSNNNKQLLCSSHKHQTGSYELTALINRNLTIASIIANSKLNHPSSCVPSGTSWIWSLALGSCGHSEPGWDRQPCECINCNDWWNYSGFTMNTHMILYQTKRTELINKHWNAVYFLYSFVDQLLAISNQKCSLLMSCCLWGNSPVSLHSQLSHPEGPAG